MAVLFLIQDERLPSSRVRVVNLLPELTQAGINCNVCPYPKSLIARLRLFGTCRQFGAVYLQKKMPTLWEHLGLRHAARKLAFDFDDAIYYRHDAKAGEYSFTRRARFSRIVKSADLVVAGNDFLANQARPVAAKVVIIPSAVETRRIPTNQHEHDRKTIVIGWIGTAGNFNHLQLLAPVLRRLASEFDLELRVVSNRDPHMVGGKSRFIPWTLETQEQEVARFDIGIMPLPATKFSEGKCGYKALQYMAAAVPPVVSNVGVNPQIVEDGRSGFVASGPDDFYRALSCLIQSRALRQEVGRRARQRVEKRYSIEVVGRMLAANLKELLRSDGPDNSKCQTSMACRKRFRNAAHE